ncbi:hypothetical protein GGS20DRAFT_534192 [Poronia punctata]|nr:hypothetical protein GGS20DRAFT_534192 [Poronia punctata]
MNVEHISLPPPTTGITEDTKNVLIYFIPGNPGLIGFYKPFLSTLRELIDTNPSLAAEKSKTAFHIYGQNLVGFSDDDHEPFTSSHKPYNLEQQIEHTLRAVSAQRTGQGQKPFDRVILIGHSVGAFIALEVFHRIVEDPTLEPELNNERLSCGIMLFPTIDHIADSPNGKRMDLLRRTPILGDNAYRIARGFLRLVPYAMLHGFVGRVLGFPSHAADITTRWLKSRDGVWQTLHLAMDEMRSIREDKWSDELWEISRDSQALPPRFYFYFGQNDDWVANRYRDEFIKKRSERQGRTRIVMDESKIPHAFCIGHSESVAEKVHGWITELHT